MREFWQTPGRTDAELPLRAWFKEAETAVWRTPADIKVRFGSASFVGNNRVVFNIAGNKCRLVVAIRYDLGIVFIRFIGTHAQYEDIDVEEV